VPESLIFSNKELAFLRELKRQNVEFMLVGAAAAALQGAPVVTQDVDLWFEDPKDPGIQRALRKSGGIMVPSFGQNPPTFAGDAVKLFDIVLTMHGLGSYADEKKNSLLVRIGSAGAGSWLWTGSSPVRKPYVAPRTCWSSPYCAIL
jgi:hypothetical protein